MARLPSKALKFGARKGGEFLTRLMIRRGFKADDGSFDSSIVNTLGLAGSAITPAAEPVPILPTLATPKKAIKKSNPNIVTLGKQLDELIKLASSIGVLSKKQQDLLVEQAKNASKVARENNLERKSAKPEKASLTTDSLSPLSDVVAKISKTLGGLIDVVEDKQQEVADERPGFLENFLDRRGYGNDYRESKARRKAKADTKAAKLKYDQSIEGRASKFTPDQLLDKNGKPLNRSQLPLRLGKLEDAAKKNTWARRAASKVGGSSIVRAATSNSIAKKIGSGISKGVSKAAIGRDAMKATVRKLAGPLVSKALGSTAVKSIPIVGAVAGLGFAAARLVEGDVVGAGLDAASGLGGPFTAIPALVASIARDIYSDVYGVKPEQDGSFSKRISELMDSVKETVSEYIRPKIQTKSKVTQTQIDKSFTPKIQSPKGSGSLSFSPPPMLAAPTNSSDYTPGAGPLKSGVSPSSNPTSFNPKAVSKPSPSAPAPEKPESFESASAPVTKGSSLIAAQIKSEKPSISVSSVDVANPTQQRVTPSKDNALGVGNVPPVDYTHNLSKQLYFSDAVLAYA